MKVKIWPRRPEEKGGFAMMPFKKKCSKWKGWLGAYRVSRMRAGMLEDPVSSDCD